MTLIQILIAATLIASLSGTSSAQDRREIEAQFQRWLATEVRADARREGVSDAAFARAFDDVSLNWQLPDLSPPGAAKTQKRVQSQAEFRSPKPYFSERRLSNLAASGRTLAKRHRQVLAEIEARFKVPRRVILAIWGRESAFGKAAMRYDVFNVIATNAFMSRRKELFKQELIAALKMVERGISPARMRGSRAGAMGQPQFLPSSYLQFAVDMDGDGKANIWSSIPDSLGSIANYLHRNGWVIKRDWGYEVSLLAQLNCAQEGPDHQAPIQTWTKKGISRISGRPFPKDELSKTGMMLVPAGRLGPAFLVTPNFYVLKKYNNSDLYALFVGNLADRIAYGSKSFKAPWKRIETMLRSDVQLIQKQLEANGYDVGGADGLPGYKTRRSIGDYQMRRKLAQTCFPNRQLRDHMRRQ